jgi:chromosome segregation ATPase
METDKIVLDLLKSMDGKIDRISQDIEAVKIKDAEQSQKLNSLEEKMGYISGKYDNISERVKKIEDEIVPKKNIDAFFNKVRVLEENPNRKIISRVEFVKKAISAGLTLILTGAVVSLGTVIWKLISNLDVIIKAIGQAK